MLDTLQLFLFEYKTAVSSSIFVIKDIKKKLLSGSAVVDSSSRKKHKGGLLVKSIKVVNVSTSGASGSAAKSAKSEGESGGDDTEIMPKGPKKVVTKCILGKPFGTINFDMENNDDDDILDGSIPFSPSLPLKHMVQVSVRKFFALDIDLGIVAGKSSQKKLAYVRKIFFGVNGFGGAFTSSKFGEIICASFTFEKAMMAAAKLANNCGIMINTNLKCPINNCTNRAIVLKKIPVGTSVEAV
ncbi:hypothetical protein G9A89_022309 [Geosiphon pyriformis]|nr:hypothetical protein G9A89_022309 [Geosiphon pyriformis]